MHHGEAGGDMGHDNFLSKPVACIRCSAFNNKPKVEIQIKMSQMRPKRASEG